MAIAIWNTLMTIVMAVVGLLIARLYQEIDAMKKRIEKFTRNEGAQEEHNRTAERDMSEVLRRIDKLTDAINELKLASKEAVKLADCSRMHRELLDSVRE